MDKFGFPYKNPHTKIIGYFIMPFRKLKNDPFPAIMNSGTMGVSMNSSMSRILSPMRNTDIKRLEKTGDWTELMQKATAQTNRFRRDFY